MIQNGQLPKASHMHAPVPCTTNPEGREGDIAMCSTRIRPNRSAALRCSFVCGFFTHSAIILPVSCFKNAMSSSEKFLLHSSIASPACKLCNCGAVDWACDAPNGIQLRRIKMRTCALRMAESIAVRTKQRPHPSGSSSLQATLQQIVELPVECNDPEDNLTAEIPTQASTQVQREAGKHSVEFFKVRVLRRE